CVAWCLAFQLVGMASIVVLFLSLHGALPVLLRRGAIRCAADSATRRGAVCCGGDAGIRRGAVCCAGARRCLAVNGVGGFGVRGEFGSAGVRVLVRWAARSATSACNLKVAVFW